MPYIDPADRPRLDEVLDQLPELSAGELNYVVTRLVGRFVQDRGGLRYANLNEAVGVLECAKLELYRRVAGPYEDVKSTQNGDAYAPDLVPGTRSAGAAGA